MKKTFIFLSIFIIGLIAFFDARERFQQLDEISANTPAQVEMKQMINKPDSQMQKDNIQNQNSMQNFQDKMKQDNVLRQNQLNNVDKRRDTINNQMQ